MLKPATASIIEDPADAIDTATEVYGESPDETVFACCPVAIEQPLTVTACGITRCVHCKSVVAA